jgi:hypothetical protein
MKAMPDRAMPEAQGRVTRERLVPGALVTGRITSRRNACAAG